MNNDSNNITAKRYANSLIEIALDGKLSFEEIQAELDKIKTILDSSQDLYFVLTNPVISLTDKSEVAKSVFEKDINGLIQNFIQLLIEKGRFNLINNIIIIYSELIDKIKNVARIEIVSAIDLDENRKETIQNELSNKLKKEIKVEYKTQKDILAGLVFKIDDNVLDTSLAHKLEELKKAII